MRAADLCNSALTTFTGATAAVVSPHALSLVSMAVRRQLPLAVKKKTGNIILSVKCNGGRGQLVLVRMSPFLRVADH
jgi:hypothetical protein